MKIFMSLLLLFLFMLPVRGKAEEPQKVVLQLRWQHQFQFAGYYMAQALGYYAEEGLDVEIRSAFTPEGKVLNAPEEVASKRADFGIGAIDILIAEDEKTDFMVVASIFQRSPTEFFMLENTPYRSPADLAGLKIARRRDDLLDIELQALLIREGIDPSVFPFCNHVGNFQVEDLVMGKFDVVPGYLGAISYYAEKKGVKLKRIKPIDYGIDFYGDTIFTRRSLALTNPELVEKFRRASIKGWEYALNHPEEVSRYIVDKYYPLAEDKQEILEFNLFQAEKVKDFTLYPVVQIGNINPYRWEHMYTTLRNLNLVHDNININDFIFDYESIKEERARQRQKLVNIFTLVMVVLSLFALTVYLTARRTMAELKAAFDKQLEENRQKEALIIHQARLAAMGEMMANIAHQWRQPLNNLGLVLTNLEDAYQNGELTPAFMAASMEKSRRLINNLSRTIEDFRDFLNPRSRKEVFYVYEAVTSVLDLMEENLRFHNIKVELNRLEMVCAYGYANQYAQAVFNVINNSFEVLKNSLRRDKKIVLRIYREQGMAVLEIEDNGGGIDEEIGDKIFQIYFTTKEKSKGTGLGLYITKTIIEQHMGGRISWHNTEEGLCMQLAVPAWGGHEDGNLQG
ncbi:ABC-type nitrate/sulfonate/bicarbonate transport system, substrate-binding protein [Thermosyntropha lipolytica DSM 11003]|uniref:histidine kinase n=1 Tax=Thermosyntropha lipolytica DSM 11003 TaxID=1123382 RepID=A0A1M5P374_9FIRM|nr:ABC-type nitrate/sulfonate/bicarbonate transport system, substrate-binding protein [Thermosyntropha lipolytica DSM 11003]